VCFLEPFTELFRHTTFLAIAALQSCLMIFTRNLQEMYKLHDYCRPQTKRNNMKAKSDLNPSPKMNKSDRTRPRFAWRRTIMQLYLGKSNLLRCHSAAEIEKSQPINKLMSLMFGSYSLWLRSGLQRSGGNVGEERLSERVHLVVVSSGVGETNVLFNDDDSC
jgi:hypothetical protein